MSWIPYVAIALSCALIVATAVYVRRRRHVTDSPALAVVGETRTTLLLSALLVVVGLFAAGAKVADPSVGGEGTSSWLVMGLICVALTAFGCVTAAYALLKAVYATEEGIEAVGPFGGVTKIAWRDVARVTPSTLSKAVKIEGADGTSVSVNGAMSSFREFVEVAQRQTKRRQGRAQLEELERRITLRG